MDTWTRVLAVVIVGFLWWSGTALAQSPPPGCDKASTPERVEGHVVKVDPAQNRVTIRGTDGTTHEFQAAKETLQDLKVGDKIDAKLRSAPKC